MLISTEQSKKTRKVVNYIMYESRYISQPPKVVCPNHTLAANTQGFWHFPIVHLIQSGAFGLPDILMEGFSVLSNNEPLEYIGVYLLLLISMSNDAGTNGLTV